MIKNLFVYSFLFAFVATLQANESDFYTLTDSDAAIRDGLMYYCQPDLPSKHIIIPDTLDGQLIIGFNGSEHSSYGVLSNRGLLSIVLPRGLKEIRNHVFYNNELTQIDLDDLKDLKHIGPSAFQSNNISKVSLSGCESLMTIGENAFADNGFTDGLTLPKLTADGFKGWWDNTHEFYTDSVNITDFSKSFNSKIIYTLTDEDVVVEDGKIIETNSPLPSSDIIIPDTLDGQRIESIGHAFNHRELTSVVFPSSIKSIESSAFEYNNLEQLDFLQCDSLLTISRKAFYNSDLFYCDLTPCKNLRYIDYFAFYDDDLVSQNSIVLPNSAYAGFRGWENGDKKQIAAGTSVNIMNTDYSAIVYYTLTDEDVVMEGDEIKSCSYDFSFKRIIIPELLDGQNVKTIASGNNNGVFYNKGLYDVEFPTSLVGIGDYSFAHNNMSSLILSNYKNLEYIGREAFCEGGLSNVDLSGCNNLMSLGYGAFMDCYTSTLNLSGCTSLQSIGDYCFRNARVETVDLTSCVVLKTLGDEAFYENGVTTLDIHGLEKLEYIGYRAFSGGSIGDLDLSGLTSLETIGHEAFRKTNVTSIDFSGCISLKLIEDWCFGGNKLTQLDLSDCSSLEKIEDRAFEDNKLENVDISGCESLLQIEYAVFEDNPLTNGIVMPESKYEGFKYWINYAQFDYIYPGDTLTELVQSTVAHIVYTLKDDDVIIEDGVLISADYNSTFKNIIIPEQLDGQKITTIGERAFSSKGLKSVVLPSTLEIIGEHAFSSNAISQVDMTLCSDLLDIKSDAFGSNNINYLNLGACEHLRSIGEYAFANNNIGAINLYRQTELEVIGASAFSFNKLTSIYLVNCKKLRCIGGSAFYEYPFNENLFFILPENESDSGWKQLYGESLAAGDTIYPHTTYSTFVIPQDYTLTDDDVLVENGCIVSCSADLRYSNLIIPDTLDGQLITQIGEKPQTDDGREAYGLFGHQSILSVRLPSSLVVIEDYAFRGNAIDSVGFSLCDVLEVLGERCFDENGLKDVDLSSCVSLLAIETYALGNSLDDGFILPQNEEYSGINWLTNWGDVYTPLSRVSSYASYTLDAWYTLTADDVTLEEGSILDCNYHFGLKRIIIPSQLNGEDIVYLKGGFKKKGIKDLNLPSTLKRIEEMVFMENELDQFDFFDCIQLDYIGPLAFAYNQLEYVRLNTQLVEIGFNAFQSNNISILDLDSCSHLKVIGVEAFFNNKVDSINLLNCVALEQIGQEAFSRNSIGDVDLSSSSKLRYLGSNCFGMSEGDFVLPELNKNPIWTSGAGQIFTPSDTIINLHDFYYVDGTYTLTDADVEMDNGVIVGCNYDFSCKKIIVPENLDGQKVIGIGKSLFERYDQVPFLCKGIIDIQLPYHTYSIGDLAFAMNNLEDFHFEEYENLHRIGSQSFAYNKLDSVDLSKCTELDYLGEYVFSGNNFDYYKLPMCPDDIYNTWKSGDGLFEYDGRQIDVDHEAFSRYRKPLVEFVVSCESGDTPLEVSFEDLTTNGAESWNWEFGDGSTSSEQNPTHVFVNAGIYDVTLTVTNMYGESTKFVSSLIHVNESALLSEESPLDFEIYPNPVRGQLHFTIAPQSVEIYNIQGGVIMRTENADNIDVSALKEGVYLVKVKTINGTRVKRMFKVAN